MAKIKVSSSVKKAQTTPPEFIDAPIESRSFEISAFAIQCYACITANLTGFVGGTIIGWPTVTIPPLQNANLPEALSNGESGWITSIVGVGALFGPIMTWLLIDKIGRKSMLILSNVPTILSYAMMSVRTDYYFLLIGRGLAGAGVGMFLSSGPLYIGEIAENRVRGAMGVFSVITTNCGCLFVYVVGPYLTVSGLNALCASVTLALSFLLIFIPESPYFYLIRGDAEKARSSLIWLRRTSNVTVELNTMKTYVESKKMESSRMFDLIRHRGNRRAMTILVILQTMQPFSGSLAIPSYAYDIFDDSGYRMPLYTLIVIMGAVMMVASFGGVFFVDAIGRRPVLFFSTVAMSVCLTALASFYTLQGMNYDVSGVTWIPFGAVMCYLASYSFGLHSLSAILLSEYFPTNVKAKAAMIFTICVSIGGGVSLKLFQLSRDSLGFGTTFFTCCAILVISTLILFFMMPETKGCSLQKIESMHNAGGTCFGNFKVEGKFVTLECET